LNAANGNQAATLIKTGAGTLRLAAANTSAQAFSGGVTVNAGIVELGHASALGFNAVTLNGSDATLASNSFNATGLGTLTVGASNGAIDLTSGGSFAFGVTDLSTWTGTLSIVGTFTNTSLRFGTTGAGLNNADNATLASRFSIAGFDSSALALDSSGYLTASAIPEPSTFAAFAGLVTFGFAGLRRRRR
jgi:autotransporter-associated beta strand protein